MVARRQQRHQRVAVLRRHRGIHQRVGLRDVQVVRGVEVVDDQRAGDAAAGETKIEIAERGWMRRRTGGMQQQGENADRSDAETHQEARSARALIARSQVMRRIALPGKMMRQ
jgi:hypothetical protein